MCKKKYHVNNTLFLRRRICILHTHVRIYTPMHAHALFLKIRTCRDKHTQKTHACIQTQPHSRKYTDTQNTQTKQTHTNTHEHTRAAQPPTHGRVHTAQTHECVCARTHSSNTRARAHTHKHTQTAQTHKRVLAHAEQTHTAARSFSLPSAYFKIKNVKKISGKPLYTPVRFCPLPSAGSQQRPRCADAVDQKTILKCQGPSTFSLYTGSTYD